VGALLGRLTKSGQWAVGGGSGQGSGQGGGLLLAPDGTRLRVTFDSEQKEQTVEELLTTRCRILADVSPPPSPSLSGRPPPSAWPSDDVLAPTSHQRQLR
jgi:hypothetical protein